MKRVVLVERYVGLDVLVWIPRPLKTRSDSVVWRRRVRVYKPHRQAGRRRARWIDCAVHVKRAPRVVCIIASRVDSK